MSMDWAGLPAGPQVMGILNVTPDSFSDGGDRLDTSVAVEAGLQMLADGAAILDVGGESTRPGAVPVSPEEEQARVLPVIRALAARGAVVSVDTRDAGTMARALDAGAWIVNDVSGLRHDPASRALIAARRCPVILMHMRGTPATMGGLAHYGDVVAEVCAELAAMASAAEAAGVARDAIALDPGFGFAKTAEHTITLLRGLGTLAAMSFPIVAGISRKSTIGMLTGVDDPRRRGPGSVAAALFAWTRGARVLRVHDVADTMQALRVWRGLAGGSTAL